MVKLLHIDPFHGASGDMFLGAFFDLGVDSETVNKILHTMKLPQWDWQINRVDRGGLDCCKVDFIYAKEEAVSHRNFDQITQLISKTDIPEPAMQLALRTFHSLAAAEAKVHGRSVQEISFHEVGALDSILDIVGSCLCFHLLGEPDCSCGMISLGHGLVATAHGEYPVPAPAVLELLKGVPVHAGKVDQELTTPTGAALIITFTKEFTPLPPGQPLMVGMGAGTREDAEGVNALRLILADQLERHEQNELVEISCNLDDIPPFALAPVYESLFGAGAVDVWITPIIMKKSRPAFLLTALASSNLSQELSEVMLRHTTSLGVRLCRVERMVLDRDEAVIATPWGECRVKIGYLEGEIKQVMPEHEDIYRMAREAGLPYIEVYNRCLVMARQALYPDEGLDV